MNKREFKELTKVLEPEWRDLKGAVIIVLTKDGFARSTSSGNLNFVERIGLATWYQAMTQRDFMIQSWKDSEIDKPPGGLVV